jgi:glycosyltransferase involved in cell wall biosynthesis
VRVAVVFYGIPAEGGGAFTIQRAILSALEDASTVSAHEFVYYSAGDVSGTNVPVIQIPQVHGRRKLRRAIEVSREMQSRIGMWHKGPKTWFERSLDEHEVDFVWFVSQYVEDTHQPYMCTIWDLAHLEHPYFPEVWAAGEWDIRHHHWAKFAAKAARVTVPNQAGEDLLVRAYPVGRERVVQQPFPTPPFALEPPPEVDDAAVMRRHGLEGLDYLFYPAQFWAHKNHVNGLHALARVRESGAEAPHFVFVGSDKGGQLAYVHEVARRLGVDDLVKVLGFVEVNDLVALYRQARALLYLSFFGPENLPPLEAMALGCPVICADVPGMREQLGEHALFVPPTDVSAIAGAIGKVADEEQREALRGPARELAQGRTPRRYVDGIIAAFDEFELVRRCWS